jgi:hypothetical protein
MSLGFPLSRGTGEGRPEGVWATAAAADSR